jgi:mevalonate kinase
MADKDLTPYQKGVIKRYYENKEDISTQKLGEIVSEIYLAKNPKNIKTLWASAEAALKNLGVKQAEIDKIVKAKDVIALAKKAEELF